MQFDQVIMRAGSAGRAIAARLSKIGKYTDFLVEAGPKGINPWVHIPVGYFKTIDDPKSDWKYIEIDRGFIQKDH